MMAVRAPTKDIIPSKRVCRKLFGEPDHDENRRFLACQMSRIDLANKQRWSFDFAGEEPLTGGRYEWEKVDTEELVPEAYSMPLLTRCFRLGHKDDTLIRSVTPTPLPLRCSSAPVGRAASPDSSSCSSVTTATQTVSYEPLSVNTDSLPSSSKPEDCQLSPRPTSRGLKRKQRHITDYFSQTKRARHNSSSSQKH